MSSSTLLLREQARFTMSHWGAAFCVHRRTSVMPSSGIHSLFVFLPTTHDDALLCCKQLLLVMHEAINLLTTVDELSAKQLGDALTAYDVKSPDTKNDISAPFPFNLMFKTSIGPKGDQVGYLRPETAQGLFVNFRWVV